MVDGNVNFIVTYIKEIIYQKYTQMSEVYYKDTLYSRTYE